MLGICAPCVFQGHVACVLIAMRCRRLPTALELYAHDLRDPDPTPCAYPMYVVSLQEALRMNSMEAHEVLRADGIAVPFQARMGNAAFIGHQWAARFHPDPEFSQFRVLQGALQNIMTSIKYINADMVTEGLVGARGISTECFRCKPLFLWYDYFSVPQTERAKQYKAIRSLPEYCARCSFFFALCPVLESEAAELKSSKSWNCRGWCRFEKTIRELGQDGTWVLIKSASAMEVVATPFASFRGSVAEGVFTIADSEKLCQITKEVLQNKLRYLLRAKDFSGYRALLHLQNFYLRGSGLDPTAGLLPGLEDHGELEQFLYQLDMEGVASRDKPQWSPLHYAALNGSSSLIEGLLQRRSNPNELTGKLHPQAPQDPRAH